MSCVKRARLEQSFNQAGARFDNARKKLLERIAVCSRAEFLALNDDVDRASELLDHTRAALDGHIRQHCCLAQHGAIATQDR